jgi:6,7-dimethyl-8-ribityllumazine synthase
MSDRYDTPSWDDEPDDLATRSPVADEGYEPRGAGAEAGLDASSENVLDGWPAAAPDPVSEDGEESPVEPAPAAEAVPAEAVPAEAVPATEATAAADVAAAERDDPTEDQVPLADHVSDSVEHAPGELTVPPGYSVLEGVPNGERRAVGVVVARFNGDVTTRLLESALAELEARGVPRDSVTVMPVPGAFELPLAAMALAKTRRFACVVALGCVIRGDTPHFDYVSSEAASGLQLAAIETGVPVAFGVLTLDRADQAESRVGKGAEAVLTGLEMADLFANLRAAAAR